MTNRVTGTIEAITRLPNSTNGNPRFRLAVAREDDDGVLEMFTTQSDASYGYEIGNPGHRVGDRVTFTLTKAGRISYGKAAPYDQRKCSCAHASISHGSYTDGDFLGIGNGQCGIDGCSCLRLVAQ